jgi:hypothetical protein
MKASLNGAISSCAATAKGQCEDSAHQKVRHPSQTVRRFPYGMSASTARSSYGTMLSVVSSKGGTSRRQSTDEDLLVSHLSFGDGWIGGSQGLQCSVESNRLSCQNPQWKHCPSNIQNLGALEADSPMPNTDGLGNHAMSSRAAAPLVANRATQSPTTLHLESLMAGRPALLRFAD